VLITGTGAATTINTGDGADTVNVQAIGAATTVNTGADDDTINVGSLAPSSGGTVNAIAARLTLDAGTGSDTLHVDDTADTAANTGTLTATALTGLGMTLGIGYTNVETLDIQLGSGGDTFTIAGTAAATITTLATNAGADTVNVRSISAATAVHTGVGNDTITVGSLAPASGGTVNAIAARLTLDAGADADTLEVDDTGETTANAGTITATTITGLGMTAPGTDPRGIGYVGFEAVNVGLGSGGTRMAIRSTAGGSVTSVRGGPAADSFTIADDGLTRGVAGLLRIDAGGHPENRLIVDDSASMEPEVVVFTASSITGLSGGTARIEYRATGGGFDSPAGDGIHVRGGQAAGSFVVESTLAGSSTTISGGAGGNTVRVGGQPAPRTVPARAFRMLSSPVAQSLSGILGPVILRGDGGTLSITLDNTADTVGRAAMLDTTVVGPETFGRLLGLGNTAPVSWVLSDGQAESQVASVVVKAGAGANTITVNQSHPVGSSDVPVSYRIEAGPDADTLVLERAVSGTSFSGANFTNFRAPNANNVWQIDGPNRGMVAGFAFESERAQNLLGGSQRDIFRFMSTAAAVTGSLDGGAGANWLDYSAVTAPMVVNLGSGVVSLVAGRVERVDNVLGSAAGSNRIYGTARGGVLVGRGGYNLLQAGNGRTILIGGTGLNTLTGGIADDIIIDGSTRYDANVDALDHLRNVWQVGDRTFKQRHATLRDVRAEYHLTPKATVVLNARGKSGKTPRVLVGNGGATWYFTTQASRISSFKRRTDRLSRR
jgi:hypothetical protein